MANKIKEFHDAVIAFMRGYNPAPAIRVNLPVQTGTLTYSGSAQTPAWDGYDSMQLLIGGTTSATNAGTYTATFTPQGNVTWTDGTSSPRNATWTIARATPALTSSRTTANLEINDTVVFTVTTPSGGTLSVTSSDESVATATISGHTVTVTGTGGGTATIRVSQAVTTNYSSATVTCAVTVSAATTTLTLSSTSIRVAALATKTFTVRTPSDGALSVTSSDESIATATISGHTVTVTGTGGGTVTIRVSQAATTNYSSATVTCAVTVLKLNTTLRLTGGSGNDADYILRVTGKKTLTFGVETNSDGTLSVTSSDESVATATISGHTVTVTPTFEVFDTSYKSVDITVRQGESAIYSSPYSATKHVEFSAIPRAIYNPNTHFDWVGYGTVMTFPVHTQSNDGELSIESSNPDIVTATISGKTVTLTISAPAADGLNDVIQVKLLSPATDRYTSWLSQGYIDYSADGSQPSILEISVGNLYVGDKVTCDLGQIAPRDEGDFTVVSENPNVATVAVSGRKITITAVAVGETSFYVVKNGVNQRESKVDVVKKNPRLELEYKETSLVKIGDTAKITVQTLSSGTLSVESSNPDIVTATISGKTVTFRGVAKGTATITVTQAETGTYQGGTGKLLVSANQYGYV